jgi:hypothetical protein
MFLDGEADNRDIVQAGPSNRATVSREIASLPHDFILIDMVRRLSVLTVVCTQIES